MNYSEIRGILEKTHRDKFKFERWITEEEVGIISNALSGYPVCYESGTANGLSSYFFQNVISGLVHTYDPIVRPKIWELLSLDHSRVRCYSAPFSQVKNILDGTKNQRKAFFIDGDHTYAGITEDWVSIFPFLTPQDVVVFHDTFGIAGVNRFVNELSPIATLEVLSDNPRRGIIKATLNG